MLFPIHFPRSLKTLAAFLLMSARSLAIVGGSDDFNDNAADPAKWGTDRITGSASFSETSQRLQYAAPLSSSSQSAHRPWILNRPSANTNWELILELHNSAAPATGGYASIGIEVFHPSSLSRSCYTGLFVSSESGGTVRGFESGLLDGSSELDYRSSTTTSTDGAIKISYDAATKVISFHALAGTLSSNPVWQLQASYGTAGTGGASSNASWNMAEGEEFQIAIFGYSRSHAVTAGTLRADNFSASSKLTANTLAASGISSASATLNGTVHPAGVTTEAVFEYSASADFSSPTALPPIAVPASQTVVPVSAVVSGLASGTTYHFRLKATNASASTTGKTLSFSVPPYRLNLSAGSGSVTASPLQESYAPGTQVTLTATPPAGSTFLGWTGDVTGTTNPVVVTMNSNKNVTANFSIGLAEAVDAPGLTFSTGGNGTWFGQGIVTREGSPAAQSGAIGNSQQSWFETTVTGPGELKFWWKVSSDASDYLEFYIDNVRQQDRISGSVDWHQKTHLIPEGTHTLRWRYAKDFIFAGGSDAGWVDGISWQTGATGFALWRNERFTAAELQDPSFSGPQADPDGDGVSNLLEYALGTLPKDPSSRNLPSGAIESIGGKNYLTLTFAKPSPLPPDLLYTVRVSSDLAEWFSGAVHTTTVTDNATTLKVRDNIPVGEGGTRRFLRLEVETR